MSKHTLFCCLFSLLLCACSLLWGVETPRVRPADWAQPMLGVKLGNCHRVSEELYRSEQPGKDDLESLKALGIKTLLSLRHYHRDPLAFEGAGIRCLQYQMDAESVTEEQLREVLKMIRDCPKPVLIHCWHGSDRTGFVVAGYRMAFLGWTTAAAVDEFKNGGFGYHESIYPNIERLLLAQDAGALRALVFPGRPPAK